jgi:hypothetical protein
MSTHSELPVSTSNYELTTLQLAKRYQVTCRTIQSWRDRRLIPFIRVNSRLIRYDADAVDLAFREKERSYDCAKRIKKWSGQ